MRRRRSSARSCPRALCEKSSVVKERCLWST